jgi:hypothetical protein
MLSRQRDLKVALFDFFTKDQLSTTDYGSFDSFYGTKALFFAEKTSEGLFTPQDKIVEFEDYLSLVQIKPLYDEI